MISFLTNFGQFQEEIIKLFIKFNFCLVMVYILFLWDRSLYVSFFCGIKNSDPMIYNLLAFNVAFRQYFSALFN